MWLQGLENTATGRVRMQIPKAHKDASTLQGVLVERLTAPHFSSLITVKSGKLPLNLRARDGVASPDLDVIRS